MAKNGKNGGRRPLANSAEEITERVKLLRFVVAGESQRDFADKLDIDMKRWNNFERGFPIPREMCFILIEKLPGLSVDWLWFGWETNLSNAWKLAIQNAKRRLDGLEAGQRHALVKVSKKDQRPRR